MATTAKRISEIDRRIDAIRAELNRREKIDAQSSASWQRAWDRHPDLRAAEIELFRARGHLQIVRDEAAAKMAAAQKRSMRARKCPTCGHKTMHPSGGLDRGRLHHHA